MRAIFSGSAKGRHLTGFADHFAQMNGFGRAREPFACVVDFRGTAGHVFPLASLPDDVAIFCNGGRYGCFPHRSASAEPVSIQVINPIGFDEYAARIAHVHQAMRRGDTYLLNFTCRTPVFLNGTLDSIFVQADAPFRFLWRNRFVCFSPERFIRIADNQIATSPMKGTVEASLPDALERLLGNSKEHAEHVMVVDLLRNDLSLVASDVRVDRFRYPHQIVAGGKHLWQTSSDIIGRLDDSWHENIGTLLQKLLPAGSISGAPKLKTVEIIQECETYERKFYTGIFGVYDGVSFDSAVMIRFLEQDGDAYFYKSGGGITIESDPREEYAEMIGKIYVPVV